MKKELYDMRVRTLFVLVIMLGIFFALAPLQNLTIKMLEDQKKAVEKFIPESFMEKLKDWDFYIYTQWQGKNLGQAIPIIAAVFAFPLFAREYENKTMEFLLVRKSRKYVFATKIAAGLLMTVSVILILEYLPLLYSAIAGKTLKVSIINAFALHQLSGAILWFAISLFFSTFMNDQVKPLLSTLGAIAVTTALGILKPLKFLNTYAFILGGQILKTGKADIHYAFALFALGTVFLYISWLVFRKKEI